MRFIAVLLLLSALCAPHSQAQTTAPRATLPAETQLSAALLRPIWAQIAKPGNPFYAVTQSPLIVSPDLTIPAGTFVQGTLNSIVAPTNKSSRAVLDLQFNQLLFANGYTLLLTGSNTPPVRSTVTVKVTTGNDLLLDEGDIVTLTLPQALQVNATRVAQAIALSVAPEPGLFIPATLCRPDPGTPDDPGTSDTTIPGNPGTPDTVIPGVDGAPDTVIPGIPATPDTVIPGRPPSPGTPPTYCPDPPSVVSSVPYVTNATPQGGSTLTASTPSVTVNPGTVAWLTLLMPIPKKISKPGDTVRALIAAPVAVGNHLALPLDAVVEGQLTAKPARSKTTGQAFASVHFTQIVFANGYTAPLDATDATAFSPSSLISPLTAVELALQPPTPTPVPVKSRYFFGLLSHTTIPKPPKTLIPAGWQFQMSLSSTLTLDRTQMKRTAPASSNTVAASSTTASTAPI